MIFKSEQNCNLMPANPNPPCLFAKLNPF